MTHDIDDLVVSWLTRGSKLSEEMAREAVAEIRWTERRAHGLNADDYERRNRELRHLDSLDTLPNGHIDSD